MSDATSSPQIAQPRAPSTRLLEPLRFVDAGVLNVAYYETGPADGPPVFLMHGFPYDIHSYVDVAPALADRGCRVIVPYMRGYGSTRFLDASTPRSGEQAAFGADLKALIDALGIPKAVVAGYDWGGRAACVCAVLWPEVCRGLVSLNGYNIQDIAKSGQPAKVGDEVALWYQWYFQIERGRAGLTANRREIAKTLWRQWSPNWKFDDAMLDRSVAAHDNPDYVDVVIHSYRHRYGLVDGDPQYRQLQAKLAEQPAITVPSITLDGDADGVIPVTDGSAHAPRFSNRIEHRIVGGAGHNLPQEEPEAFARAVLDVLGTG